MGSKKQWAQRLVVMVSSSLLLLWRLVRTFLENHLKKQMEQVEHEQMELVYLKKPVVMVQMFDLMRRNSQGQNQQPGAGADFVGFDCVGTGIGGGGAGADDEIEVGIGGGGGGGELSGALKEGKGGAIGGSEGADEFVEGNGGAIGGGIPAVGNGGGGGALDVGKGGGGGAFKVGGGGGPDGNAGADALMLFVLLDGLEEGMLGIPEPGNGGAWPGKGGGGGAPGIGGALLLGPDGVLCGGLVEGMEGAEGMELDIALGPPRCLSLGIPLAKISPNWGIPGAELTCGGAGVLEALGADMPGTGGAPKEGTAGVDLLPSLAESETLPAI
ncbi:hypothetical protein WICPIJ_001641 [Wickerhamomyces pijperi]|uniref:Uncharacterized protein n=1 Tax=Wickerhamomyces pijperi TaxID=599730 RepID=A0A9P8TQK7_WICPI|nr:hypothetical protein WICPIJ_001641 [Wickerhamomyces pijperi]